VRPIAGDLLALLLALPAALPFLLPGWFFGHDNMHLIRLFEQDVMVQAGHFPVRWYPDVAGGYGSPHPQFYAPLFYLLAQAFRLVGLPLAASLKAAVIVVVLASSLGMFRLARAFLGSGAALVAAAAYTYAPYHLLDLFVRTAFSEMTVFALLPFVLLAFYRLASEVTPLRIAGAAAALGALCLSHTITVMLVPPLVGGYVALLAWQVRFRRSFLFAAVGAGLLGVLVAAFFLVPLVAEKGSVETEIYARGYFDYRKHFPTFGQLLSSPWGHGMSREGTEEDGISFRLGFLQILGCVIAAAFWRRLREALPRAFPHLLFAAAMAAAGIFMSLPISAPVWSLVPPLRFVQFPWRFLMLPAFGMPLLCAAATLLPWLNAKAARPGRRDPVTVSSEPEPERQAEMPRWAVAVICVLLTAAGIEMIGFKKRIPLARIGFGGDHTDMRERDMEEAAIEPTVFSREFIRRSSLHWFDHIPPSGYPYPPERDLDRPRAELVRGSGDLHVEEETPVRYSLTVRARQPSMLRLNVYRFPGWRWRLDGEEAPAGPLPGKRPALTLEVPPGEHEIVATFERTAPRWAGDLTSLASLLTVTGLAGLGLRRGRPRDSAGSAGR
jgi:hypothetical protein